MDKQRLIDTFTTITGHQAFCMKLLGLLTILFVFKDMRFENNLKNRQIKSLLLKSSVDESF